MGSCEVRMSVQEVGEVDVSQLLVVKGDHAALLGRKTAEELGVLRVGLVAAVHFTGGLTKDKLKEMYLRRSLVSATEAEHRWECNTCGPTN